MRRIDRREFAREASLAFLSGITVTVSACAGGGYSRPTGNSSLPASNNPSDEIGQVSANHGHAAVVQAAWLQAGNAVDLDIRGNARRTATWSPSWPTPCGTCATGKKVQKESTTADGHTHA